MELLQLRLEVNKEIEEYSTRSKVEVFHVFIPYEGNSYYTTFKSARDYLLKCLDCEEEIFSKHESTILNKVFITQSEVELLCRGITRNKKAHQLRWAPQNQHMSHEMTVG